MTGPRHTSSGGATLTVVFLAPDGVTLHTTVTHTSLTAAQLLRDGAAIREALETYHHTLGDTLLSVQLNIQHTTTALDLSAVRPTTPPPVPPVRGHLRLV